MKVAILLNSGSAPKREISADIVICADGGYNHCPVVPNYVIGDLDSILPLSAGIKRINTCDISKKCASNDKSLINSASSDSFFIDDISNGKALNNSVSSDIKIIKHDTHKNFTDGEAAVHLAKDLGANDIEFFGVLGGRFDHVLGNLNIMALAHTLNMTAVAREDNLDIYFGDKLVAFDAEIGDIISALPHSGDTLVRLAEGVEYPLDNLVLTAKDSRGISNVAKNLHIVFHIASGNLFVFHYLK